MNPDTAEIAIPNPPHEPVAVSARAVALGSRIAAPSMRRGLHRTQAARDCWRALWSSRALAWGAGAATVAILGFGPIRGAFDPPGTTSGFGWLGNVLAAPVARWDSAWYLVISHYGYRPDLGLVPGLVSRTAFFPLYPLGIGGLERLGVPPILAGVAISTAALGLALYGIHRLVTLELGDGQRATARLAVQLSAFAPMAFFLSAVYSEGLYLALSVGTFWCARKGRWEWACVLAGLGGATRSAGIVLALPVVVLYLYGPREDRQPDRPRPPRYARGRLERPLGGLLPRYRLRRDVLWLALTPAGLGLYMAHLAISGGNALRPFHAQAVWGRHFAGPYVAVWDGAKAAFEGARQLLSGQRAHAYLSTPEAPFVAAGHDLILFAFLLAAVPAIVGVLRRLPAAYGLYVLGALAMPLSYPANGQPLMSLPRFLVVLFPLNMWLASVLVNRPRLRVAAVCSSAVLEGLFVAQFATWHWVA
jgi:Mannosyltransferase (PIG-V)